MSDDMFKRPSGDSPEERPNQHDPDKTLKHSMAPVSSPTSEERRSHWQDTPAVKLYETPLESISNTLNANHVAPPPPINGRDSAGRQRARKRAAKKRTKGADWAWVIVAGVILFSVLIIGMTAVLLLQGGNGNRSFVPTATLDIAMLPAALDLRERQPVNPQDAETGDIILLSDGTPLELRSWDGDSRFTILLMGIDRRPGERGMAYLTDTMMVISIDPRTRNIGILSIPRDLYVPIPGYAANQRINSAMALGETRSPGTGPALTMQTVQNNLGIRIHEYVVVDFQAVIDIVNAIGGITVSIDYAINDPRYPDMNYGYDPFYLAAGTHTLNGSDALKFARTRHNDNDLERARRQQEVVFAVRDKVTDLNMIPNLIVQAPTLFASLSDNVKTGLSLSEIIQLAWFVRDIPRENITTNVIDYQYVQNHTTERGEQVLIPVRSRLGGLMVETFGANYSE